MSRRVRTAAQVLLVLSILVAITATIAVGCHEDIVGGPQPEVVDAPTECSAVGWIRDSAGQPLGLETEWLEKVQEMIYTDIASGWVPEPPPLALLREAEIFTWTWPAKCNCRNVTVNCAGGGANATCNRSACE